MFVSLQFQKSTIVTQLIKIKMEQKELTNTYQSPKITVVTFKIEAGFTVSLLRSEQSSGTDQTPGIEPLSDGGSLDNHFPRPTQN